MEHQDFINSISFQNEEWKEASDFPGYYVSSCGRVVSTIKKKPRLLKIYNQEQKRGTYAYVCIKGKKGITKKRVHQLIASTFLPKPKLATEVDHINGIGTDNRIENLRWCSHKENMNNIITAEKIKKYRTFDPTHPELYVFANKHEDECKRVGRFLDNHLIKEYKSLGEAAKDGYLKTSISAACHGRLKTYRGYTWKFVKN